jgi:hypothetical protein
MRLDGRPTAQGHGSRSHVGPRPRHLQDCCSGSSPEQSGSTGTAAAAATERKWSSATVPSACAACWPPSASVPGASSCSAATSPGQELARAFGATDIVAARGEEAVEAAMQLMDGVGADATPDVSAPVSR